MNLEIRKPETMQRVSAEIQLRNLQDADELIEQALDALDRQSPAPSAVGKVPAKDMVELFAPLRGLDIDFDRDTDPGRDLEL